jgi:hypothetical protein
LYLDDKSAGDKAASGMKATALEEEQEEGDDEEDEVGAYVHQPVVFSDSISSESFDEGDDEEASSLESARPVSFSDNSLSSESSEDESGGTKADDEVAYKPDPWNL